jgi:hypothetical protein
MPDELTEARKRIMQAAAKGWPRRLWAAHAGIRNAELDAELADPAFAAHCDEAHQKAIEADIRRIIRVAKKGNKEAERWLDEQGINWRPAVHFNVVTPSNPRHPDYKRR